MDALHRLRPQELDYTTDSETIGKLDGPNELCPTYGDIASRYLFSQSTLTK